MPSFISPQLRPLPKNRRLKTGGANLISAIIWCRAHIATSFSFSTSFRSETAKAKRKLAACIGRTASPKRPNIAASIAGAMWSQKQVRGSVKHGYWKATKPFNRIAGFHINSIYSFSPKTSMARLARGSGRRSKGDPLKEQTFFNLKLGLTYDPAKGSETTPDQLFERREDFGTYLTAAGIADHRRCRRAARQAGDPVGWLGIWR